MRQRLADADADHRWLEPPRADAWRMTVVELAEARSPDEHVERSRRWARAVWEAWSPHHEAVRTWAAPYAQP